MGRLIYGIQNHGLSAVYNQATSKGNQVKYTNSKIWVKLNYFGYEDIAEEFTSELLKCSNLYTNEYVEYRVCSLADETTGKMFNGCVSQQFTTTGESIITVGSILKKYGISQKDLDNIKDSRQRLHIILDTTYRETGIDITDYLKKLFTLDAIILNEDRHLFNIALIVDSNVNYRPAPIFDNGLGLLSDTHTYMLDTPNSILIRKIKARPINSSFKKQVELIGTGFMLDTAMVDSLVKYYNNKRIESVINNAKMMYPNVFV